METLCFQTKPNKSVHVRTSLSRVYDIKTPEELRTQKSASPCSSNSLARSSSPLAKEASSFILPPPILARRDDDEPSKEISDSHRPPIKIEDGFVFLRFTTFLSNPKIGFSLPCPFPLLHLHLPFIMIFLFSFPHSGGIFLFSIVARMANLFHSKLFSSFPIVMDCC